MVKVAIMGYGVVGSGVAQVLTDHYDSIAGRAKEEIDIKYILDLRIFRIVLFKASSLRILPLF